MANGWGGARPGAGRPRGSIANDPLTKEERRALRAMRFRVPPELEDSDVAEMADEALETIVDVMRQKVHPRYAKTVLSAAAIIREEVCGPVVRRVEVQMGLADLLAAATADSDDTPSLVQSIEVKTLPASVRSIDVSPAREEKGAGPEGPAPELHGELSD